MIWKYQTTVLLRGSVLDDSSIYYQSLLFNKQIALQYDTKAAVRVIVVVTLAPPLPCYRYRSLASLPFCTVHTALYVGLFKKPKTTKMPGSLCYFSRENASRRVVPPSSSLFECVHIGGKGLTSHDWDNGIACGSQALQCAPGGEDLTGDMAASNKKIEVENCESDA